MNTLRPTHHCFDDTLDFMSDVPAPMRSQFHLVHGICVMGGVRFAHAWIETADVVLQSAYLDGNTSEIVWHSTPRARFMLIMSVERFTRYTHVQARIENERTLHFGPWDDEYRSLCGDSPRDRGIVKVESTPNVGALASLK